MSDQYVLILLILAINICLAMKCHLGYNCLCTEEYDLVNCIDAGIRNMSLLKFNERHFKNVRMLNLQRNDISELDWDLIESFDNLQTINVKQQNVDLYLNETWINMTDIVILHDYDTMNYDSVTESQLVKLSTKIRTKISKPSFRSTLQTIINKLTTKSLVKRVGITVTSPKISQILTTTTTIKTTTMKLDKSTVLLPTRKKFPLPAKRQQPTRVMTTIDMTTIDMTTDQTTPIQIQLAAVSSKDRELVIAFIVSCIILVTAVCILLCYIIQVIFQWKCCRCGLQFCICYKKKRERYPYTSNRIDSKTDVDTLSFESVELFSASARYRKDSKDS